MSDQTSALDGPDSFAVRRVVTGHDPRGKAVVIEDGPSDDVLVIKDAHVSISDMWQLSALPTDIDSWERRDSSSPMAIGPIPGGLHFRVLRFDPAPAEFVLDAEAAFADMGSAGAHVRGARHPAMHRTDTVDLGVVISGSITLMLDDADVTLSEGDVIVQRGTIHAWENRSDAPCVMAIVVTDASRS